MPISHAAASILKTKKVGVVNPDPIGFTIAPDHCWLHAQREAGHSSCEMGVAAHDCFRRHAQSPRGEPVNAAACRARNAAATRLHRTSVPLLCICPPPKGVLLLLLCTLWTSWSPFWAGDTERQKWQVTRCSCCDVMGKTTWIRMCVIH